MVIYKIYYYYYFANLKIIPIINDKVKLYRNSSLASRVELPNISRNLRGYSLERLSLIPKEPPLVNTSIKPTFYNLLKILDS